MGYLSLSNGVKMPDISFGTSSRRTQEEVECAIELGYRFIDCAYMYQSEEVTGLAINKCIKEGLVKREDLFIQSKAPHFKGGYNYTLETFEKSLENLGLDYLDSYVIHYPQRYEENWKEITIDTWRAFEKLYKEGKVKSIGVSNFLEHHLEFLMSKAEIKPMFNQIEVHPLRPQDKLVTFCQKNNIVVQAWSPLGGSRVFNIELLKELSKKYKTSITKLTLKWDVQKNVIPVLGLYSYEEMLEVITPCDFTISDEDMVLLESLNYGYHTDGHSDGNFLDWTPKTPKNTRVSLNESFVQSTWKLDLFGFIPFIKVSSPSQSIKLYYLFNIKVAKSRRKFCQHGKSGWSKKDYISGKYKIDFIFSKNNSFLECPVWDEKNNLIYCIASSEGEFYQINPKTKDYKIIKTNANVTGSLIINNEGNIIVAHDGGVFRYDIESDTRTFLKELLPANDLRTELTSRTYNDGKADAKGRFIVGTNGKFNNGKLYSFDGTNVKVIEENITCSNGIAFSLDNKYMYYIDSVTKKVAKYKYDLETGDVIFDGYIITITDGTPDGMCTDIDDNIWVAEFDGNRVSKHNPYTGEKLDEINFPVNVTSCSLGGENLEYLYVTTSQPNESNKESGLCRVKIR